MYPTHQRIINAIWRKKRDRFWYTRKTRTIDPLLYSPNGSLAPYHYPNHHQDLPALQTTSSRTCVPALERNVDVIAASLSLPTSGYPRRLCGQKRSTSPALSYSSSEGSKKFSAGCLPLRADGVDAFAFAFAEVCVTL